MLNSPDDYDEPDWSDDPVRLSLLPPGEQVAILKRCTPRARDLFVLALIDPLSLDEAGRIDLLTMFDEIERVTSAAKLRVLAAVESCDDTELHLAEEQVALALTVPGRSAQRQLQIAATVAALLPGTAQLLGEGRISNRHVEILAEASWRLPPELVGKLETAVLGKAPHQTPPTFARSVRRAELKLDPADAEARHQRARQDRRVGCQPIDDGMVSMPVVLPAADGQAIFTRLTAAALLLPKTDPRTMDQKRADLLVDAVLTGIPVDALPKIQGRAPSIQVVVAADTLLELDDEPAHLTGYGPLTAETARRLAADQSGTWRRLLTDQGGRLIDVSENRYRPSRRLRDFVSIRDDVCSFPTCNQPGYRCEYEHIVPYRPGDSTCACNGALACRRHNRCKIKTGWSYRMNADGAFIWTTATGHEYENAPVERWQTSNERTNIKDNSGQTNTPDRAGSFVQTNTPARADNSVRPDNPAEADSFVRPDTPARDMKSRRTLQSPDQETTPEPEGPCDLPGAGSEPDTPPY